MTDTPDFERTLAELEAVVEKLQRSDVPLEEAVTLYRRGTELVQRSEALLSDAELQVQQLTRAVQERISVYSVDVDDSAVASEESP